MVRASWDKGAEGSCGWLKTAGVVLTTLAEACREPHSLATNLLPAALVRLQTAAFRLLGCLPTVLQACSDSSRPAQVGFGSSVVGVGATNGLGKVRQMMDPEASSPNPPQDLLSVSGAYGAYMSVSSNLRYQVRFGCCSLAACICLSNADLAGLDATPAASWACLGSKTSGSLCPVGAHLTGLSLSIFCRVAWQVSNRAQKGCACSLNRTAHAGHRRRAGGAPGGDAAAQQPSPAECPVLRDSHLEYVPRLSVVDRLHTLHRTATGKEVTQRPPQRGGGGGEIPGLAVLAELAVRQCRLLAFLVELRLLAPPEQSDSALSSLTCWCPVSQYVAQQQTTTLVGWTAPTCKSQPACCVTLLLLSCAGGHTLSLGHSPMQQPPC